MGKGGLTWRWFCAGLALVALTGLVVGCRRAPAAGASITLAGSTSVQPFAELLAEDYMSKGGKQSVNVQGGGSSAGIQAAETGAAQIGMSSRELKPDEKAVLYQFPIAHDAIAIIVNPTNHLDGLTSAQVRGIFSGVIRNWKDLGGPDKAITVISREEGSGTRGSFDEMIMKDAEVSPAALVQDSNGSVRETVAGDPYAIGYLSLGLVDPRVRAVKLDGVEATLATARSKEYPVVRPFLFLTKAEPTGTAKDFIDYVLSPEGQKILLREGLVPVDPNVGQ